MDANTFQRKYHDYCVKTQEEALAEIGRMEIVEGHLIEAVEFPGLGWALMLDVAAKTVRELEII